MRPDYREFTDGLKLAAIALASAAVTATLVIGAGRAVLERPAPAAPLQTVEMVRTSAR